MFSLLYSVWRLWRRRDEYFVLILGLDHAGKTTLLEQTKAQLNRHYRPLEPARIYSTVGLNIGQVSVGGVRLSFWDLGGQPELQPLWDKYYAECHAVVYVVDSCDQARLDDSWQSFDLMLANEHLRGVPVLLLGNKQDLLGDDPRCLSVPELKQHFDRSAKRVGHRDCHVMGVSALSGHNVQPAIEWVLNRVKRNSEKRPPKQDN